MGGQWVQEIIIYNWLKLQVKVENEVDHMGRRLA